MSSGFGGDDLFGSFFGSGFPSGNRANSATPKPEKGLPWRAKEINGELYLPITQVVELLEQNNVLPEVRMGLEKHIKKDEDKT